MKHKQTKATDISQKVKRTVEERDSIDGWPCCIVCGSTNAEGHCHFIPRKHGGLGIEENIWTGCQKCHDRYDKTSERDEIGERIEEYLKSHYTHWSKEDLVYDKWKNIG